MLLTNNLQKSCLHEFAVKNYLGPIVMYILSCTKNIELHVTVN